MWTYSQIGHKVWKHNSSNQAIRGFPCSTWACTLLAVKGELLSLWQVLTGRIFTSPCLHLWSRLLASLVSFRFVLGRWVNQSSYIHPCLQFRLIYEQQITQSNLRLICHLSLRCTGKVFSCYKYPPFPLLLSSLSTCATAASGPVWWRAVGETEERSLAASPAVCSSRWRVGCHTLPCFSVVIALPSTPKDTVPLTAITHCHFSSLRVSVQWHPPSTARWSGCALVGWKSHWRQTLIWLRDKARCVLNWNAKSSMKLRGQGRLISCWKPNK